MDNISVYKSRLRMGEKLGDKILAEWGDDHDIDGHSYSRYVAHLSDGAGAEDEYQISRRL